VKEVDAVLHKLSLHKLPFNDAYALVNDQLRYICLIKNIVEHVLLECVQVSAKIFYTIVHRQLIPRLHA
jgi:hypothetical protein